MLRLDNLKLNPDQALAPDAPLRAAAARALRIHPAEIDSLAILRRSLDARKKRELHFVYAVELSLKKQSQEQALLHAGRAQAAAPYHYMLPHLPLFEQPPVVVGAGPAGLFAALILADKTDVRRTRVRNTDPATWDIHDRVNSAVSYSRVLINPEKKEVELSLHIDTTICSVTDYFEIFLARMILCRKAAEKLGLRFSLRINGQRLM